MNSDFPLLEVKNLSVRFKTARGDIDVVRNVSFNLGRERLGIVGESGSGKSQTARAILGLTPNNGTMEADQILFDGLDLSRSNEQTMKKVRGARISMIMQDPRYSLNPVMSVGEQVSEAYRVHSGVNRTKARYKTIEMLNKVRIREPEKVFHLFPHEVSGGMGQRIMIAMMLIPDPDILIADEPTSALDVTVQLKVLSLIDEMVRERGMGLIFISHDLNLVFSFCDRVLVMYAGQIMETLETNQLKEARHPYTQGLFNSLPKLENSGELPILERDPSWLELIPKI